MKHLHKFLLGVPICVVGCHGIESAVTVTTDSPGEVVVGSGPSKSQELTVPAFKRIDIGSSFVAHVSIGPHQSVTVQAPANILEKVVANVQDGALKVKIAGNIRTSSPLVINIVTPSLEAANFSGAVVGDIKGLSQSEFKLRLSGASQGTVHGAISALVLDVSGNSTAKTVGLGRYEVSGEVSGASHASLDGIATTLQLELSGTAEFEMKSVDASNVKITATGASTAKLAGMAKTATADASGSSTLDLRSLMAETANVQASGASKISIGAKQALTADASGASQVNYVGSPSTLVQNKSGASSIEKAD